MGSLPVVFGQAERIDHLVIRDGGPHSVGGVGINPVLNADLTVDHVSISGMARGINVATANGDISDTQLSDGDEGIEVFQGLLVLNRSSISHFTTGVLCGEESVTCTYIRSTFTNNIIALDMQGARDILSHDILEHNGIGVSAAFLSEADVSDSLFGHNTSGIRVDGEGIARVQRSTFEYNVVGVRVPISTDEFPATTELRSNTFRHNRDGLLVTNIRNTSTLGGNNAYFNASWGLYAAGIVHDLGGNKGHGNGFAAQCFHVACS